MNMEPVSEQNITYNNQPPTTPLMSVKDWMITMLILAIPIVNIVMLFVWAFGDNSNPTRANYCKASLLWFAIVIGLYIVIFLLFFVLLASAFN